MPRRPLSSRLFVNPSAAVCAYEGTNDLIFSPRRVCGINISSVEVLGGRPNISLIDY